MKKISWLAGLALCLSWAAEAKVDYSRCIPQSGADQALAEFTLNDEGEIARKKGDNFDRDKGTASRELPGQSTRVSAQLRKVQGKNMPLELVETYSAYDNPAEKSYSVVTRFAYAGDECYVSELQLRYFDGEHKGKSFVQYQLGLCDAFSRDFRRARSEGQRNKLVAKYQKSLASYFEGKRSALRALSGLKSAGEIKFEHLQNLQDNCQSVSHRFPPPRAANRFQGGPAEGDSTSSLQHQDGR